MTEPLPEDMLERERVANLAKHWVRFVTACNSHCLFCLDSDTPRNVYLPADEIQAELRRGREELGAWKVIVSGGEASLHPQFAELVRYAKDIGYGRVQTVTNGWQLSEKTFYDAAIQAGLGEITFSLHGHTEELHDRLTRHPGSFRRITKAILRAVRDPRHPIVNVDVVINKQNVGVLDKVVELAISLGVTEFDLLHVIPQAAAFEHREELFYDVRDHMQVLHKVFRLNRHPRFVVWTNRFPVEYLEGLEDLIQDPHKMLDEVNGRRFQVRRYLDEGTPLDCRDKDRCPHCFIEPFCTTADRVVAAQNENAVDVWEVGTSAVPSERPYGTKRVEVSLPDMAALVGLSGGIQARVAHPGPVPEGHPEPLVLVADTAEACEAWVGRVPEGVDVLVLLDASTAAWMLEHRDRVSDGLRVHQPSHEHLAEAHTRDVRDPAAFFGALDRPVRVSGLPICLVGPARHAPAPVALSKDLFDPITGRLDIRALARHHVARGYFAKSVRCADCRVDDRCDGAHVNWIRDQGLARLNPITGAVRQAERDLLTAVPEPITRVRDGVAPRGVAASLPGFPGPQPSAPDPLAVIGQQKDAERAARHARSVARAREAGLVGPEGSD